MSESSNGTTPRTLLEQLIRQRHWTFEEFAEFAETFARDHGESGTLSARHVQRLASGRGPHGRSPGRPRPATARLLERIFGVGIDELLSSPSESHADTDAEIELRQMIRTSARVDDALLALLHDQLTATRRLDRQLGGLIAHDEVLAKIKQVTGLMNYSVTAGRREQLAALLSELRALAGWQVLDMGDMAASWQHYSTGTTTAGYCVDPAFAAHTAAGQAFALIDLGETHAAAELLEVTRDRVEHRTSRLMRSWLAAAHGETLAADGQRGSSLRAFDRARSLLDTADPTTDGPYVALDQVHLARWRGHALARVGEPEAVRVLSSALDNLDPTFVRAETALRADLATAFIAVDEREPARHHAAKAEQLATEIGSTRQRRRIEALRPALT